MNPWKMTSICSSVYLSLKAVLIELSKFLFDFVGKSDIYRGGSTSTPQFIGK